MRRTRDRGASAAARVSVFEWVEATRVASAIRESLTLTATLSATHLIGFTLITGGALLANLRCLGVLLTKQPLNDVMRPASRGIALGLAISVFTGGLSFSTRATAAAENSIFQAKMTLLVAAVLLHFTVQRRLARAAGVRIAAGSDFGGGSTRAGQLAWEVESLVRAGLEPWRALGAATWRGGQLLGIRDAGRIREGGPADFMLVHGDPLSDPSALWRIWRVAWVDGGR